MAPPISAIYIIVMATCTIISVGWAQNNNSRTTQAPTGGFDADNDMTDLKVFQGQRAVLDEPIPLNKEQLVQLRAAVRNGTVDRICAVLRSNGTIPRLDYSLSEAVSNEERFFANISRPIIIPSPEQQAVIDECFTPYSRFPSVPAGLVQPEKGRRRRNVPGARADVACRGGVSSVLFVQTPSGCPAQVIVTNIGSAGQCFPGSDGQGSSKCNGRCRKVKFEVFALSVLLKTDTTSMTFESIEVEHCTCCQ